MARKKNNKGRKRPVRSLQTIHPNAAGIDLDSRKHWVAGPPREDQTPNVERSEQPRPNCSALPTGSRNKGWKPRPWRARVYIGFRCSKF